MFSLSRNGFRLSAFRGTRVAKFSRVINFLTAVILISIFVLIAPWDNKTVIWRRIVFKRKNLINSFVSILKDASFA